MELPTAQQVPVRSGVRSGKSADVSSGFEASETGRMLVGRGRGAAAARREAPRSARAAKRAAKRRSRDGGLVAPPRSAGRLEAEVGRVPFRWGCTLRAGTERTVRAWHGFVQRTLYGLLSSVRRLTRQRRTAQQRCGARVGSCERRDSPRVSVSAEQQHSRSLCRAETAATRPGRAGGAHVVSLQFYTPR